MADDDKRMLYDRRVVKKYINAGEVKESDFQTYLKKLPDEEKNGEWVTLDVEETEVTESTESPEPDKA